MHKFILFVSLFLSFYPAFSASFDCGRARSEMEKLICSDEKLSKADEELNVVFKQAVAVSSAKPLIRQWQRQWLQSYEVAECKDVHCLTVAFNARIEVLKSVAAADDGSAKWNGKYVRFFKGREDPDSASLLLVGLRGNRAYISGEAIWVGPNAANGQVNSGEIDSVGQIVSRKLVFDSDGCKGEIQLTKNGVVIVNDSGCGGLNVSFNGEYRKK